MTTLLRPEILSLAEYRLVQHPCRIKLNQNENPYDLPDEVKKEVLGRLAAVRWSHYPPFVPTEQLAAIARFAGWRPEGTLLGNGSNELLQLIFTSVLERGSTVVLSQPTFSLYGILARSLAAQVLDVPMLPGFRFDVEGIVKAAREGDARLVVLCSPNNPTGTVLTRAEVLRILTATSGLVVLDEAYVQFAPETQVGLLGEFDRLIILQTFSKAMGAAGLRFGYALGPPELMKHLEKVKLPYNVNIFTLIAAEILIERWDVLRWWIARLKESRDALRRQLGVLPGITVYPSGANFLLIESAGKPPGEIFTLLAQRGILIRDVSTYPMLARGLRITVGTPEENDELVTALREIL